MEQIIVDNPSNPDDQSELTSINGMANCLTIEDKLTSAESQLSKETVSKDTLVSIEANETSLNELDKNLPSEISIKDGAELSTEDRKAETDNRTLSDRALDEKNKPKKVNFEPKSTAVEGPAMATTNGLKYSVRKV